MRAIYDKCWLSEGYESPEEEARYRDYGWDILKRFVETHTPGFRMPLAVERSFILDVEGIKLRGFIDRIDKLESNGLSIVDYKTNRDIFTKDYVENDLQLTVYQMAAEQMWDLPVELLTLFHLRSNTPCSAPARSRECIEETRRLILDVAEKIESREFPATENRFCPCDFPQYCPYYRHLSLTAEPEPDSQPSLTSPAALDAARAVDRYAELQTSIRELQTELEELRQSIIEYCGTEGLKRLFGAAYELTYSVTERTGFPEDEVKALLEPAGLWEMVTKLDEPRLRELMNDDSLDESLRERLAALRRVTSSYPQLRIKKQAGNDDP